MSHRTDVESRALRWRMQKMMRVLEHDRSVDPYEALLAVVAPCREVLEASLAAVGQERERATA